MTSTVQEAKNLLLKAGYKIVGPPKVWRTLECVVSIRILSDDFTEKHWKDFIMSTIVSGAAIESPTNQTAILSNFRPGISVMDTGKFSVKQASRVKGGIKRWSSNK